MNILAFDTTLQACSAALAVDGRVVARRFEAMERGHAERLPCLVRDVLKEAALPAKALDRLAVTVGPGSFAGVRVGLAFARGMALRTEGPALPIATTSSLEALALGTTSGSLTAGVIDARRGEIFVQAFRGGMALNEPRALSVDDAASTLAGLAGGEAITLIGTGATLVGEVWPKTAPPPVAESEALPDAARFILRAAELNPDPSPQPLYLRAPDAKPQKPSSFAGLGALT